MFEKYAHSIVDVCQKLNGSFTGSGDSLDFVETGKLVQWLEWRIDAGWDQTSNTAIDQAVRKMAVAIINEYWGKEMVK